LDKTKCLSNFTQPFNTTSFAFLLNLWKLIYHLMEYMSVWYDNFVDRRNFGVYISTAKYKIKIKNSDITGLPDPHSPSILPARLQAVSQ